MFKQETTHASLFSTYTACSSIAHHHLIQNCDYSFTEHLLSFHYEEVTVLGALGDIQRCIRSLL